MVDRASHKPDKHWTDGFPHSFHGWGPLTPDSDHPMAPVWSGRDYSAEIEQDEPQADDYYGGRFHPRLRHDDQYFVWRGEEPPRRDH
jgi:hypothetical protein